MAFDIKTAEKLRCTIRILISNLYDSINNTLGLALAMT